MRRPIIRPAVVAALAVASVWLLAASPPAVAGTYTVNACQADRFGFATQAFVDFGSPALGTIPTRGLYMRRACAPTDAGPIGLVAGNVLRSGRVKPGHQAGFVMDAPPGTSFLKLDWSGKAQRRDCRYAIQMYAVGADGSLVKKIRNWRANRNCPKTERGTTRQQVAQVGIPKPEPFAIAGATRIVQRAVCVGGSRKRFCSARSSNRITTFYAQATVADGSPPAAGIVQDNPFTQGAWVNGSQTLSYTASDNVGVKAARAVIGGSQREEHTRPCDYTRTIPCTNDPAASRSKRLRSLRERSRWSCGR